MKKLELKHLAPYLPYELKMRFTGEPQKQFRGTKVEEILTIENYKMLTFSHLRKPILRPLSDLTKEIEINEEKFVPMDILNDCLIGLIKWYELDSVIDKTKKVRGYETTNAKVACFLGNKVSESCPYGMYIQLLEWHFDVFGLIGKNLAIDINTL